MVLAAVAGTQRPTGVASSVKVHVLQPQARLAGPPMVVGNAAGTRTWCARHAACMRLMNWCYRAAVWHWVAEVCVRDCDWRAPAPFAAAHTDFYNLMPDSCKDSKFIMPSLGAITPVPLNGV